MDKIEYERAQFYTTNAIHPTTMFRRAGTLATRKLDSGINAHKYSLIFRNNNLNSGYHYIHWFDTILLNDDNFRKLTHDTVNIVLKYMPVVFYKTTGEGLNTYAPYYKEMPHELYKYRDTTQDKQLKVFISQSYTTYHRYDLPYYLYMTSIMIQRIREPLSFDKVDQDDVVFTFSAQLRK